MFPTVFDDRSLHLWAKSKPRSEKFLAPSADWQQEVEGSTRLAKAWHYPFYPGESGEDPASDIQKNIGHKTLICRLYFVQVKDDD